ncbi:MAG: energy-coupling factor ABC transporter permease [Methanomassiliicoccales archaeon]|nr:energy-coupling factor ABC transporter permease [Methanomassiliicoccales archaeon]
MHIPDGLMSPEVLAAGWVLALPAVAWAVTKVNKTIDERVVPFMAILAAGIFVAQMVNFPIGGGTTGHLIGAALAVALLGLCGGILVMTVILIIQGLVFGDGGITAMGLNVLNMAVIAPLVAWIILMAVPERRRTLAVPLAAWASVFVAATACGVQLAVSFWLHPGQYGIDGAIAIPTMMLTHAVIGVGEAAITGGIVLYLSKVAPEVLAMRPRKAKEADA